jgi:phenylpropionate dioxygenase-like ring-hydroxylating dioxygenase large terminal subunit
MSQVSRPQPRQREERDLHVWPRYEAAALGFREYWYPATWSRGVGSRPRAVRLLGDPVMLRREQGKLHAFYDQCPHRGIPLSVGRQEFPGTWSCRYHGWTYDCQTGVLRGALTDGPDSPICGKVRVRTYPVEERAGLVWVWMGDGPPSVPVEADIPEEMLAPDAIVLGRGMVRGGNWRLAAENGYDQGHVGFLHRYGALWTVFNRLPAWVRTPQGGAASGPWLRRAPNIAGSQAGYGAEYLGLGYWPRRRPWNRKLVPARTSIRLPSTLQVCWKHFSYYAWYVPVDADHHQYFQLFVQRGSPLARWRFWLEYWVHRRWLNAQFTGQDSAMIELMPMTAPERLYRPDASIIAWRRLCEHARGDEAGVGTGEGQPDGVEAGLTV